ncbi:MAG TPA: hypothetical protein VHR72_00460, partial [Gemmataceae bacterium]|nr:hypothetical protein [Gemmataceae bacterium]
LPLGPVEGMPFPGFSGLFGGFAAFVMLLVSFADVHTEALAFGLLVFLSWLANPVFWLGFYRLIAERPRNSAFAGGMSVLLGLFVLPPILWGIPAWPAYWTWLGSFATLAIGSAACEIARRRRPEAFVDSPGFDGDPPSEQITASPGPRSRI